MLFSNNRKKFTIWQFIIKSIGTFGEIFILPEYIIREEGAERVRGIAKVNLAEIKKRIGC
ncbi:hypothetical protein [Bacillus sp. 491mf]|uniref:hypothetical protein n=1 Tax=Bacillus sp. 491mf TaxID=1761755 RepID=UPI000B841DA2|nr:hypothetical protein [Bacillus sp. 491mf]